MLKKFGTGQQKAAKMEDHVAANWVKIQQANNTTWE